MLGTSYYIGDLNDNHFELAQPALGLIYRNNLNRRFTLKASAWTGEIRGNDKINNVDTAKIIRNLHFRSPIIELSGQIEFNFFEYETGSKRYPFSPFIFTGLSFCKHNPQARRWNTDNPFDSDGYGTSNEWIELQPLGTEGQGSIRHPGKEPYSLAQIAIPIGIGIKWSLGEKFSLVAEYGIRKTFTDYLDDVSGSYYDWAANGGTQDQITMSGTRTGQEWTYSSYAPDGNYPQGWYPAPELGGTNPYRVEYTHTEPGMQRGNPENDDSYMFLTLSAYKKFNNAAKSYRTINMHQKRKIKASF